MAFDFGSILGSGIGAALGGLPAQLVGGLVSGIGSLFGINSAKKQSQQNFQYAKDLAKYQYELQAMQQAEANFYNRPDQQMTRLREAGLNPNLLYSSGSQVVGNSNTQSVSSPHMTQAQPFALAQYQLELARLFKENTLLSAQTEQIKANTAKTEAETSSVALDNLKKEIDSAFWQDNAESQSKLLHYTMRWTGTRQSEAVYDNEIKKQQYLLRKMIAGDNVSIEDRAEAQRLYNSDIGHAMVEEFKRSGLTNREINKRIDYMSEQLEILLKRGKIMDEDLRIRKFEANLADHGMNPKDPLWARAVVMLLLPVFEKFFGIDISNIAGITPALPDYSVDSAPTSPLMGPDEP